MGRARLGNESSPPFRVGKERESGSAGLKKMFLGDRTRTPHRRYLDQQFITRVVSSRDPGKPLAFSGGGGRIPLLFKARRPLGVSLFFRSWILVMR
ncbi:hypothetical protein B296_00004008 [Ensete ventricosum]|uniref:Uncharacterized protein n=1 Tax=Ensete ventricosum TaxID=4639 RepID=A0A427B8V8_ENSVE|nr:hypothetical protein B296_00004008 [Ensete ventricosum]